MLIAMAVAGQMHYLTLCLESSCRWLLNPLPAQQLWQPGMDFVAIVFALLTHYKYLPSYHVRSDSCN